MTARRSAVPRTTAFPSATPPATASLSTAPPATALLEAVVDVVGYPFAVLIDATTDEVVAGGFCAADELYDRLAPADRGARTAAPHDHPVVVALRAYDTGEFEAIDAIAVRQSAPPFRRDVHATLRRIPPGIALTYSELAAASGRPAAVRAAGSACATNLVALIVPCHRVRRTDGTHGGYAYGVEVKGALLRHEGVAAAPSTAKTSTPIVR